MVTVRDARVGDFEKVCPLLLGFNNPQLSKEHWRELFVDHSGCQDGRFGYILFDGEDAVGFLGTTFSERTFGGKKFRFCNMSNWIVKNEYRAHSLALLAKVMANENVTITNLSPTPSVLKICRHMGFTLMDRSPRMILPTVTGVCRRSAKIVTNRQDVEAALSGEQLKICRDHSLPWNHHALVQSPEGECYLMMNRTKKIIKGKVHLPIARVHYLSNADVFARYADRLVLRVAVDLKVIAMLVEERMLRGHEIWYSVLRPGAVAAFKSSELTAGEIDNLYSEMVLLN